MDMKAITPAIGMQVSGIDLAKVSDADAGALRDALIDRKVLVFRNQPITSPEYVRFMTIFGEVVQDDLVPHEGHPKELCILRIRPKEKQYINYWHMDYSFRPNPTPHLSLSAQMLPECGGDTLFTNLEAAYEGLDDDTKQRISGLQTNHQVSPTQNGKARFSPEEYKSMTEGDPVRHPLVGRNPENGRDYLFVNVPIFCRSITDMENPEGDALLASLYAHAQRPEFHFRLTWELNTLVVWENTHCLHYPVSDYFPNERMMWRLATRAVTPPRAA
jgi:alpha-ketoglutarate-dependent taurine dioxygenase